MQKRLCVLGRGWLVQDAQLQASLVIQSTYPVRLHPLLDNPWQLHEPLPRAKASSAGDWAEWFIVSKGKHKKVPEEREAFLHFLTPGLVALSGSD